MAEEKTEIEGADTIAPESAPADSTTEAGTVEEVAEQTELESDAEETRKALGIEPEKNPVKSDKSDELDESDKKDELPEAVKERIQKRIDREVAKRKELEEDLRATRAAQQRLEEQLHSREQEEREQRQTRAPDGRIHPAMLAKTEEELEAITDKMADWEAWLTENSDGFDGDAEKQIPAYTAQQIRQRLAQIRKERETVIPRARRLIQERRVADKTFALAYPDLSKPESDGRAEVEQFLKRHPELMTLPEARLLIADSIAGRKARLARKAPPVRPASGAAPTPVASAAPGHPTGGAGAGKRGLDSEKLKKGGYTRESLAEAMLGMF